MNACRSFGRPLEPAPLRLRAPGAAGPRPHATHGAIRTPAVYLADRFAERASFLPSDGATDERPALFARGSATVTSPVARAGGSRAAKRARPLLRDN